MRFVSMLLHPAVIAPLIGWAEKRFLLTVRSAIAAGAALSASVLPWGALQASSHEQSCHRRTVRLQVHGDRALVPVVINGRTVAMVLDTGAAETVLVADTPTRLGLQSSPGRAEAQMMSYGRSFSVRFVRADTMDFAGSFKHSVDLGVLPGNQGVGEAGGFFADVALQEADFDLRGGALRLACPPFSPPGWTRQRPVTKVPLEHVTRVFGAGSVRGVAMRVLFDTGSPTSSITLAAARRAGVTVDAPPDTASAGLAPGVALRAWTARVDNIRLGDSDLPRTPMLIVDKPHASADMIIGFDFFRQHRVWIDRSRSILIYADRHQIQSGQ